MILYREWDCLSVCLSVSLCQWEEDKGRIEKGGDKEKWKKKTERGREGVFVRERERNFCHVSLKICDCSGMLVWPERKERHSDPNNTFQENTL